MSEIDPLLEKLANNQLSPEEKKVLFLWLKQHREPWIFSLYSDYIRSVENDTSLLDEARSSQLLQGIYDRIKATETEESVPARPQRSTRLISLRQSLFFRWATAAAVVLVGGLVWWFSGTQPASQPTPQAGVPPTGAQVVVKTNAGPAVMPLALPDGSSVWLYPQSRIEYPAQLRGARRELLLQGKAFFEVNPDPNRPFAVTTREMVTEVLGTSFTIEAFDHQPTFSVTVKTGKVSVSAPKKREAGTTAPAPSIALIANQQATFQRTNQTFSALALEPRQLAGAVPVYPAQYTFSDVPAGDIFHTLSRDYGTKILFDENVLTGCSLTTTLKDKPFFEKLRIICEAIGPSTRYEVEGDTVRIVSLGCNN